MRRTRALFAVLIAIAIAATCAAQVSSPPPICFAFNDTSPPGGFPSPFPSAYATALGSLLVHFVAPTTSAVERIDIWSYICSSPTQCDWPVTFQLYQTPSLGSPPSSQLLATFTGTLVGWTQDWKVLTTPAPIVVSAGATYVFSINAYPPPPAQSWQTPYVCVPIPYDPNGFPQLIYQFTGTPACPVTPTFPSTGIVGLMMRFRGLTCGPGPPATVETIGTSCGSPGGPPYTYLLSWTPPVLGSTWPVIINGPGGGTANLFWSGGFDPIGTPISPGSACLAHLDMASLASLASLGAEPIATAILPVMGSSGTGTFGIVTWSFPVPTNPVYAGLVLGVQAIVVTPYGTIPLGGGLFAQASNGIRLKLGF